MIVVRGIPIYWGIETDAEDRSLVTRSWLVEDIVPFRQSITGFRIRVSQRHWLHIGLFRYRREALHLGLSYRPTDIGKWGKDAVPPQDDSAHGSRDSAEAGSLAFIGSGASSGVISQSDGRTVSWTITQGVGDEVGTRGDGDPPEPGHGGDADPAPQG